MDVIKVLIVEQDAGWQHTISDYLRKRSNIAVVSVVASREQALQLISFVDIDVAIIDVRLTPGNGTDGICTAAEMMNIKPVKVIMFTSCMERQTIIEAFKIGIVNCVDKSDLCELPEAIYDAYYDRSSIHRSVSCILREEFSRLSREEEKAILTKMELEILRYLHQGIKQSDIERCLNISRSTVKYHVHNILSKLKVPSSKQAVLLTRAKKWF